MPIICQRCGRWIENYNSCRHCGYDVRFDKHVKGTNRKSIPIRAFKTKNQALVFQYKLKNDVEHPVQHVHITRISGNFKWQVSVSGKNGMYWRKKVNRWT